MEPWNRRRENVVLPWANLSFLIEVVFSNLSSTSVNLFSWARRASSLLLKASTYLAMINSKWNDTVSDGQRMRERERVSENVYERHKERDKKRERRREERRRGEWQARQAKEKEDEEKKMKRLRRLHSDLACSWSPFVCVYFVHLIIICRL